MENSTPIRSRINASFSLSKGGYTFEGTIEGPAFEVTVAEQDENDVGSLIKTNQGAILAANILKTRKEFQEKGLPVVAFKKFTEKETDKS